MRCEKTAADISYLPETTAAAAAVGTEKQELVEKKLEEKWARKLQKCFCFAKNY